MIVASALLVLKVHHPGVLGWLSGPQNGAYFGFFSFLSLCNITALHEACSYLHTCFLHFAAITNTVHTDAFPLGLLVDLRSMDDMALMEERARTASLIEFDDGMFVVVRQPLDSSPPIITKVPSIDLLHTGQLPYRWDSSSGLG